MPGASSQPVFASYFLMPLCFSIVSSLRLLRTAPPRLRFSVSVSHRKQMADASAPGGGQTDAARLVIQQVFGDDSDSEQAAPETLPVVEVEAAEETEGAAAGEEEPVLNTKRAQKQSMRDKLQLLAQGRKAEDGASWFRAGAGGGDEP